MSRSGNPAKNAWDPMQKAWYPEDQVRRKAGLCGAAVVQMLPDEHTVAYIDAHGQPIKCERAFRNRLYNVCVTELTGGALHLSIHRHDRAAVRDWRHLQAIKNEVAGPEREAVEIYPRESRLLDQANEYHLFVLPEGEDVPFGDSERQIGTVEQMAQFQKEIERATGKPAQSRQREWEPGLPTGAGVMANA